MTDEVFDTPGTYEYTVPDHVYEISAKAIGAAGAGSNAGRGQSALGRIPVDPGETLEINVGGQDGTNGGGGGGSNNGGGATDIRQNGATLGDRVLVGGGGGGAGTDGVPGGDGGHPAGDDGGDGGAGNAGGGGGTQDAGGSGGGGLASGDDGQLGEGGDGETWDDTNNGGGGGGGLYGGGGGGASSSSTGAGGGAGSSFADESVENESFGDEYSDGDGYVEITEIVTPEPVENFEVVATRDTELDLEWDVTFPDADGQRLYQDTESGIDPETATEIADLGPAVESYTDPDLLNGSSYYYLIETYLEDGEGGESTALSDEISGQTTVPNLEQFTLDGSEPDQLVASIPDILNTGQYRVEYRRSNSEGE